MYRYYIKHNGVEREIYPLGSPKLTRRRGATDYGGFFWVREMSELMLSYERDSKGYNTLLEIENGIDRCKPIEFRLAYYVNGHFIRNRFMGSFSASKCKYDLERCTIKFTPKEENIYECLDRNKDKEMNMLGGFLVTQRTLIKLWPSGPTEDYIDIEFTSEDVSMDPTWRVESFNILTAGVPSLVELGFRMYQFKNETEVLSGWVHSGYVRSHSDGNKYIKWVKHPGTGPLVPIWTNVVQHLFALDQCYVSQAIYRNIEIFGNCYSLIPISGPLPDTHIMLSNGRTLNDVLYNLLYDINCSSPIAVKSDFFQINSFDVSDVNYVTGGYNYWKNPMLYQISDIKNPDADNDASKAIITFKKLMSDLFKWFKVVWWIEQEWSTEVLRIEHISRAEESGYLDCTDRRGFNQYEYDQDDLPSSIVRLSVSENNLDYTSGKLEFDRVCTNGERTEVTSELLCSDIDSYIRYPENTPNQGIVIVAHKDGYVWSDQGDFTNCQTSNAPMSWANLLKAFHRDDANALSGFMNGYATTYNGLKRIKKQDITIKDCDHTIDDFTMIKTQLGHGRMESVVTDLKTEVSKIEIKL